jgi:hypothetical protein
VYEQSAQAESDKDDAGHDLALNPKVWTDTFAYEQSYERQCSTYDAVEG